MADASIRTTTAQDRETVLKIVNSVLPFEREDLAYLGELYGHTQKAPEEEGFWLVKESGETDGVARCQPEWMADRV